MNNHCNSAETSYTDPFLYDKVLKIPAAVGCKIGKALWQKIENEFPAEEKYEILAPGIGTGRFVIPFLLAIPDEDRHKVQVYAIEKDPNMYSYLIKKLQELKLQEFVVPREVDFEKYVTEDDKKRFHACFAFFIFHHLKDPIKGIDDMVSFLKPNGLFFFSEEQGDKILWDTNFQHVNYKELQEIIKKKDEARLSFVRSAYSFSRRLARKGRIRYPLISAGDNTATIDYLEEIGLTNLWDNNNKQEFSFYQDLKKDEWFATIRKGMFSFLPRRVAKEYPDVIDDTEKNLLHSEFTIKNRLRIYAFQAKKPSQAANGTLPVPKRKLLSRRIKQASVLRFAQRIIDDDIYKEDGLFQNELKNRLQLMENYGFFEKSVFVYLASWALHKGPDGDWRQEVPVWISKVNDSDESETPWNFIATQFLYLLLSEKDVELSDFKIVNFVLRDMPDKCILAVEYFDNSPSRWDVNFDRFGKVEKITIPCSKRLVSLLTPFLEDITSIVQYLKDEGISKDIQGTKKGWTISLKKFLDLLDGSTFNTKPILAKMKEVSNDTEFKKAIDEGKKFFKNIRKFTGRESWKSLENQLTKLFIALLYTKLVGSFDKQRKWSHLYYISGATHSEALPHEKEYSSFCWMMLRDKELPETEERHLRLTANLYGRADSTWSWAQKAVLNYSALIGNAISHNLKKYLWMLEQKREDKNLWPYLMNYIKNQAEWLHYASIGKEITRSFQIHKQKVQNLPLDYSGKRNTAFTTYFLEKIIETAAGIKALEDYRDDYQEASHNLPSLKDLTKHLNVSSDEMGTFIKDTLSIRFNPDEIERLIILKGEDMSKLKGFLDSVSGELLMNALRCAFSEESVVGDRVVINVKGEGDNVVLEVKNILGGCRDTSDRGYSSLFENTSDTARILDLASRGELEKIGGLVALAVTMQAVSGDIKLSRSDGFYITTVSFFDFMKKERENDR